jgi:hypothetical protein
VGISPAGGRGMGSRTVTAPIESPPLVERLFAEVTQRCVRRGSHTAVRALEKAMLDYLDQRNRDPKPFV